MPRASSFALTRDVRSLKKDSTSKEDTNILVVRITAHKG
jgi:hypothetical protein